jgi:hypothetical protein
MIEGAEPVSFLSAIRLNTIENMLKSQYYALNETGKINEPTKNHTME